MNVKFVILFCTSGNVECDAVFVKVLYVLYSSCAKLTVVQTSANVERSVIHALYVYAMGHKSYIYYTEMEVK
jgi:hypothetical protein